EPLRWRLRLCGIAREPGLHFVVIRLFTPQQSRERLPLRLSPIVAQVLADARREKFVRLFNSLRECGLELRSQKRLARKRFTRERVRWRTVRQPQTNRKLTSCRHIRKIMRRY